MIRQAIKSDLPKVMEVIESARSAMLADGLKQWNLEDGYPTSDTMLNDIKNGDLYVNTIEGSIAGCMMLSEEIDHNYNIENFWPNDVKYISIHRIAVKEEFLNKGIAKGLFEYAENYSRVNNISEIRIDTHKRNQKMIKLLKTLDYTYVGEIDLVTIKTHNTRNAYYKTITNETTE